MGRRQPCVRAFSRTVPVWRPGCGRQAWCVSHERRYVQGSRGPMWGSGFGSPPEQHGVQGGGSVAGAGLSWSQGTGPPHPTSAPHLRSRKALTLPLGRGHHGGYSQTVHPCSAATWGLVGVGRPRGERACEEEEGPCRETCWPSMQKGESGALTLLRSHLQMAAACPLSPCETSITQDFISKSSRGSVFAYLFSSGWFWNLPDCRAGWGGVRRAFRPSLLRGGVPSSLSIGLGLGLGT